MNAYLCEVVLLKSSPQARRMWTLTTLAAVRMVSQVPGTVLLRLITQAGHTAFEELASLT